MVQQKLRGLDLHIVVSIVVLSGPGEVVKIIGAFPGIPGDGHIALCLGIAQLDICGQEKLGEEPGGQDLLGVLLVEQTDRRALGDHFWGIHMVLGNGQYGRLKVYQRVRADVQQRSVGAYPGGSGGGVDGEDALPGVEEVGGIAGNLEGGEGAGGSVLRNCFQDFLGVLIP